MSKVLLFDLDGVLSSPGELFSVIYTKSKGYELAPFTNFFETDWDEFVTGRQDLKDHIASHPEFWKWDQAPDKLLDFWFESQSARNYSLIEVMQDARKNGIACFIATEQEKHRTNYVRNFMFKNDVDGVFSTAEIGYKKNDVRFYEAVLEALSVNPSEVIFFDDSQSKVATARSLGIDARIYETVDQVQSVVDQIVKSQ